MKSRYIKAILAFSIIACFLIFSYGCKKRGSAALENEIPEVQRSGGQRNSAVENSQSDLNNALKFQNAVRNVAKSITPAVVNIRAERIQQLPRGTREFFYFFRRQMPQRRGKSIGSGFIINKKGYIVTNAHVVKNATKITAVLQDEREISATLIGIDEQTDIALLKINPSGGELPTTPLGDSERIKVGDFAIAIGNPFGLRGSVTFGIISAKGRSELNGDENATLKNFIQTDVPINRGNSGGPLLNIRGQVIGVNTMIYSPSGGNIGIGFAIPINIVKSVVKQLLKRGRVERGYIGAAIQPLDDATARHFGITKHDGVLISSVVRGGPSDRAGLRSGDIILEVNGKKVKNFGVLKRTVTSVEPGNKISLVILRKGKKMNLTLKVGRLGLPARDDSRYYEGRGSDTPDSNQGTADKTNWLGMLLSNNDRYQGEGSEGWGEGTPGRSSRAAGGLLVKQVSQGSQAESAGIKAGDVIKSINYKSIKNLGFFSRFLGLAETKNAKSFFVKIQRGRRIMFITIEKSS